MRDEAKIQEARVFLEEQMALAEKCGRKHEAKLAAEVAKPEAEQSEQVLFEQHIRRESDHSRYLALGFLAQALAWVLGEDNRFGECVNKIDEYRAEIAANGGEPVEVPMAFARINPEQVD